MIRANENRGFNSLFWELFGRFPWEVALKRKETQGGCWCLRATSPDLRSPQPMAQTGSSSLGSGTKREDRGGQGGPLGSNADHCLVMQAGNWGSQSSPGFQVSEEREAPQEELLKVAAKGGLRKTFTWGSRLGNKVHRKGWETQGLLCFGLYQQVLFSVLPGRIWED